jgi:hypothetical protein
MQNTYLLFMDLAISPAGTLALQILDSSFKLAANQARTLHEFAKLILVTLDRSFVHIVQRLRMKIGYTPYIVPERPQAVLYAANLQHKKLLNGSIPIC